MQYNVIIASEPSDLLSLFKSDKNPTRAIKSDISDEIGTDRMVLLNSGALVSSQ